MKVSNNYQVFVDSMADIDITSIVRLYDFCQNMRNTLKTNTIEGTHCDQDFEEEIRVLERIVSDTVTDKLCPHCNSNLFCSDLPQYDYTCVECDENFYECEVR